MGHNIVRNLVTKIYCCNLCVQVCIHSPCYSFLLYSADSDFHGETFEEIWKDISEDDSEIVHEHLSASSIPLSPLNDPLPSTDPSICSLVLWLTGFLLLIQARYFTSDAIIDALLKFLCLFQSFGTLFPICCKIGNCTSFNMHVTENYERLLSVYEIRGMSEVPQIVPL